jgi:hypothetical protein
MQFGVFMRPFKTGKRREKYQRTQAVQRSKIQTNGPGEIFEMIDSVRLHVTLL